MAYARVKEDQGHILSLPIDWKTQQIWELIYLVIQSWNIVKPIYKGKAWFLWTIIGYFVSDFKKQRVWYTLYTEN